MRIELDEPQSLDFKIFAAPSRWRRSKKGNLWRRMNDGTTITIFSQDIGYGICIHDASTWFSRDAYESERDAIVAAYDRTQALK